MQYMGGKERIARRVASQVLRNTSAREVYFEPFVGGGSTAAALAISFRATLLADANPDVTVPWDAALRGWEPPASLSEDDYRLLRGQERSALRSFAGFGCSFGGKFFGGYARSGGRNYAAMAASSLRAKVRAIGRCPTVDVFNCDFRALAPGRGAVVYCDPPYRGTEGYSTAGFPHDEFWQAAETWSRNGAQVVVSEYQAPPGWRKIWEAQVGSQLQGGTVGTRTEALFLPPLRR